LVRARLGAPRPPRGQPSCKLAGAPPVKLPLPPGLVAGVAGPLRLLARTWRIDTVGEAGWRALADAGRPYVLLSWHDALLPCCGATVVPATIVVSEALDGAIWPPTPAGLAIARRGSSTAEQSGAAGGGEGAPGRARRRVHPDGPRGPRRCSRTARCSRRSGCGSVVPVPVPVVAWRLRSADRLLIPRPFARVRIVYGTPFQVEPGKPGIAAARSRAPAGARSRRAGGAMGRRAIPTG
jgi:lysophospholipid acyltransferase (LPLAT)-like uncharacterized protein